MKQTTLRLLLLTFVFFGCAKESSVIQTGAPAGSSSDLPNSSIQMSSSQSSSSSIKHSSSSSEATLLNLTYNITILKPIDSTVYVDSLNGEVLENYQGAIDTFLTNWTLPAIIEPQEQTTALYARFDSTWSDSSYLNSEGALTENHPLIIRDSVLDTLLRYDTLFISIPQAQLREAETNFRFNVRNKDLLLSQLDTIHAGGLFTYNIRSTQLKGDLFEVKILNAPEFISFNSYFYCDSPPDTSYFLQEKYGAPGPSDGCGYNQPVIQSDIHSFDIDTSFQWNLILSSRWGATDTLGFTTVIIPAQ